MVNKTGISGVNLGEDMLPKLELDLSHRNLVGMVVYDLCRVVRVPRFWRQSYE
jgi:hypothetical protein